MGRIKIEAFKCERCGHIWLPRGIESKIDKLDDAEPKVCPKCKSPYWNTPRKLNITKSK